MEPGESLMKNKDVLPLEEAELKVKQSILDLYNALLLESLMKTSGSIDYLGHQPGYIKNHSGSTNHQTS